jgi:hypothetical protein
VYSRRCGTAGAPPLVPVHGFPTSSIDYFALQTLVNQPEGAVLVDQSAP